ncbi:hypothetical protein Desgi_4291 [Desulfoscipio gibsoniae DSM 7213]|uniref:Uncharacterized protein n=1 Tax=Desulfoscipio gibsoniae DSM 7213 TaxID=767817 RepID=R4KLK3_9FIRM|nr:hypothetical protein Desgi_4291 [Desulfoscipio gibsoniae DSM 7213]
MCTVKLLMENIYALRPPGSSVQERMTGYFISFALQVTIATVGYNM